jgi:hypothetical protein
MAIGTPHPAKKIYFHLQNKPKGRLLTHGSDATNTQQEQGSRNLVADGQVSGNVHPALFGPYSETTRINT